MLSSLKWRYDAKRSVNMFRIVEASTLKERTQYTEVPEKGIEQFTEMRDNEVKKYWGKEF